VCSKYVQGQTLGISRYRQEDLPAIATVITALTVLSQVFRSVAFEVNAGQIVEHQSHVAGNGALVRLGCVAL